MVQMQTSDAQLLREYAEKGNEAAFRELVVRHTDLVYSVALRLVGSPDLAGDVAQRVFTDLACKASRLLKSQMSDTRVLGWLYRGTRFAAMDQLRQDRRRQARERQAMALFDPTSDVPTDWSRIHPVLDDAMADLNDDDREALLLRFFKNLDFRSIGDLLGVSDDAAQKRVGRALEKLRTEFVRRGVTATAVALSSALSANAVGAAPAGLAVMLSNAALGGAALATAGTATQAILMTTLQKSLIGIIAVATVATPIALHLHSASRLRAANEAMRQQADQLAGQEAENERLASLAAKTGDRTASSNELLRLRAQAGALRSQSNALPGLRAENRRLRAAAELPEVAPTEAEKQDFAASMAESKKWLVASYMYSRKNQGQFPPTLGAMAAALPADASSKGDAPNDRVELVYQGSLSTLTNAQDVIVLKQKEPVRYGNRWAKAYGYGDGHVEMHVQADSDFADWEAQHLASPAASNP
jgi:RNA polymerase sigma factor (sigma-70 family)